MKRTALPLLSFVLVLTLLLTSSGSVNAAPGDDPTVTPVSGDTTFTTTVIPISSLPGTTAFDDMTIPVGFPAGEAQFGGAGILVQGFDSGKATACFSLSALEVSQGWGGKVAVWDGGKWVRLATTLTSSEESNTTMACATITGNGTYAFIKYVTEPDKLPKTALSVCQFGMDYIIMANYGFAYFGSSLTSYNHWIIGLYIPDSVPAGVPVTYSITQIDPAWPGAFVSGLTGSTTARSVWSDSVVFSDNPISVSETPGPSFVAHIVFPTLNCYLDLDYYDYDTQD